jgi:FkbM family methyltransferase
MDITIDKHWLDVAEFLNRTGIMPTLVVAPDLFDALMPGIVPYGKHPAEVQSLQAIVVHKGMMPAIGDRLLAHTLCMGAPVFANEVFVVYRLIEAPWRHHVTTLAETVTMPDSQPAMMAQRYARSLSPTDLADLTQRAQNEVTIRQSCTAVTLTVDTALCRVLSKYKMYVDITDIGITPHLLLDGFWEMWITQYIAAQVRPGMRVVDIGANVGYYTLLMADLVTDNGQVVAFEPNLRLQSLLRQSININGYANRVHLRGEAVAGRSGCELTFAIPRTDPKNGHLVTDAKNDFDPQHYRLETVLTITLDDADLGRIDFIKIDAEGAESAIWTGMQRTIAANPEMTVLLEFKANRWPEWSAFLDDLNRLGFALRHVDFDGQIKPLTAGQITAERYDEDWMLVLRRS